MHGIFLFPAIIGDNVAAFDPFAQVRRSTFVKAVDVDRTWGSATEERLAASAFTQQQDVEASPTGVRLVPVADLAHLFLYVEH